MPSSHVHIEPATEKDLSLILSFIKGLAEYERLADKVVATEEILKESLFGRRRYAEVLIARYNGEPAGFALFFHNYSTFLARPGIYLEDLFVVPDMRGKGIGRALLVRLSKLSIELNCGRLEWSVLDWNELAINFYKKVGAVPLSDWTVFRLTGEALEKLAR
ncbi:MAG TPA: GNAT family N-acetyltransferase [Bacteroidota bacterium]|nr:GNAT family N-acetyltransferase [Bacteroidota bacterium]